MTASPNVSRVPERLSPDTGHAVVRSAGVIRSADPPEECHLTYGVTSQFPALRPSSLPPFLLLCFRFLRIFPLFCFPFLFSYSFFPSYILCFCVFSFNIYFFPFFPQFSFSFSFSVFFFSFSFCLHFFLHSLFIFLFVYSLLAMKGKEFDDG